MVTHDRTRGISAPLAPGSVIHRQILITGELGAQRQNAGGDTGATTEDGGLLLAQYRSELGLQLGDWLHLATLLQLAKRQVQGSGHMPGA